MENAVPAGMPAVKRTRPKARRRPNRLVTGGLLVAWLVQLGWLGLLGLAELENDLGRRAVTALFGATDTNLLQLAVCGSWFLTSVTLLIANGQNRRRVRRIRRPTTAPPPAVNDADPDASTADAELPESAAPAPAADDPQDAAPGEPRPPQPPADPAPETAAPAAAEPSTELLSIRAAVAEKERDLSTLADEVAALRATIDVYRNTNERLFVELQELENRVNSSRLAHADTWFAGLVRDMFAPVADGPAGPDALELLQDLRAVAALSGQGPDRTREKLDLDALIHQAVGRPIASRAVKVLVSPFAREVRAHGAALRVLLRCYVGSLIEEGVVVTLRATRVRMPGGIDKVRLAFEKSQTPIVQVADGLVLHGLAVLAGTLIKTEPAGSGRFVKVLYLDLIKAPGDGAAGEIAPAPEAAQAAAATRGKKSADPPAPRSWPRVLPVPAGSEQENPA
ncbi:MAG: hypothetical protein JXQ29_09605 [Planctomycetes bacterium]|nr:hypothetical protein [Planctomycetota bacterium]